MESWKLIKDIKRSRQHKKISQQQCRTLLGQLKKGDIVGANKGYSKLLERNYDARKNDAIRKI